MHMCGSALQRDATYPRYRRFSHFGCSQKRSGASDVRPSYRRFPHFGYVVRDSVFALVSRECDSRHLRCVHPKLKKVRAPQMAICQCSISLARQPPHEKLWRFKWPSKQAPVPVHQVAGWYYVDRGAATYSTQTAGSAQPATQLLQGSGALLSSPALDVRLPTALQVLQVALQPPRRPNSGQGFVLI